MGKLTAKKVQGKLKPGMHNDGAGLYLRVSRTGGRSWILRCRVHGVKRDIGLGGVSWVSLAEARDKARAFHKPSPSGSGTAGHARKRNMLMPPVLLVLTVRLSSYFFRESPPRI